MPRKKKTQDAVVQEMNAMFSGYEIPVEKVRSLFLRLTTYGFLFSAAILAHASLKGILRNLRTVKFNANVRLLGADRSKASANVTAVIFGFGCDIHLGALSHSELIEGMVDIVTPVGETAATFSIPTLAGIQRARRLKRYAREVKAQILAVQLKRDERNARRRANRAETRAGGEAVYASKDDAVYAVRAPKRTRATRK